MVMTGSMVTIDMAYAILIGLKLAREKQNHKRDNMVDVCGYMEGWSEYKEKQAWAEAKNNDPEFHATEEQKREVADDGDTHRHNSGREGRSTGSIPISELP